MEQIDLRSIVKKPIQVLGFDGNNYELRPASGEVAQEYLNRVLSDLDVSSVNESGEISSGESADIAKVKQHQMYLVGQTLFLSGSTSPVGEEVLMKNWPASALDYLSEKAQDLLRGVDVEKN